MNPDMFIPSQLEFVAEDPDYVKIIIDEMIYEVQNLIDDENDFDNLSHLKKSEKNAIDNKKVFVVYGHNEASKEKVSSFIKGIGLVPVILDEKPNKVQTIIEKLTENADVGFGVVLYTPDDTVTNHSETYKQSRSNVIFEYGYFIGKLGRKRVALLMDSSVEAKENSDLTGTGYIKMDGSDGWKLNLAKELKSSGYDVNLNKYLETE